MLVRNPRNLWGERTLKRGRTRIGRTTHPCISCRAENEDEGKARNAMDSLSSLLGQPIDSSTSSSSSSTSVSDSGETLYTDKPISKPVQADPGRTAAMDSDGRGTFLDAEEITRGSWVENNSGRSTKPDEALDIPTVRPIFSYGVIGLNILVYAVGVLTALTQGNDASNDFFFAFAKDNQAVAAGEYYRLFTAIFLHAGLLHLGLNQVALWQLAPEVEGVMGYATFLAIYLFSGLGGSVCSLLFSDVVSVGASGAIFGLLGALGGYFLRNPGISSAPRQLLFLGALVSFNLVLGSTADSLVDNAGHLGGLAVGLYLGYAMGPNFAVLNEIDIPQGSLFVPEDAEETRVVVDRNNLIGRSIVGLSCAVSLAFAAAVGIMVQQEVL